MKNSLVKIDRKDRCWWCGDDPLYVSYHDNEWGVPLHDDRKLFEMLILEGFQAGLSWITILKKRENFRKAFDKFDPQKIARYDKKKVASLMKDAGIIRNRLKIESAVVNAKAYLDLRDSGDTLDNFLWSFTNHETIRWPKAPSETAIRSSCPESDLMSKELKKRGFKFVGSTIMYAHMQATGMIDDHVAGCFRFKVQKKRK
jgi:DNA-3-methyladenine glycosylase I